MKRSPKPVAAFLVVASIFLGAAPALAHPDVDEGKALLMEAEFEQALEAFHRAEEADNLTRDDLIELLGARCLAHLAMDDAGALRQDLRRLASLAPDHRWGREAPPELGEAFLQTLQVVDGEIGVSGTAEPIAGGIELTGQASNDHGGLVASVRIFARHSGGSWRRSSGGTQAVPAGQSLEYYVEAIGPGGAVLATAGSRESPSTSDPALPGGSLIRQGEDDDGGISPWVWVGIIGGVLAAAGAVIAIVLATSAGPAGTQPQSPLVIGF